MRFKFKLLVIPFLLFSISFYSNPIWGPTGHRTLGKIADKYLKKSVRCKIEKLLNGESLAFVSTYGDEIKSDRKFDKFYTWHYINFPEGTNYKTAPKNPKGDLYTGINTCILILKDKNSTNNDKVFYLKMLVHLIGDLHQPLHAGHAKDKGGNTIQVQWFGRGTNLHHVWDVDMIEEWNMSYIELANNSKTLTKTEINNIKNGTILDWIYESQKLAKQAYNSVENGSKLSYNYSYGHFGTVRNQLQKGGIRLAKILNDIFK